ncbi:hypothetical protein ANDO1_1725 [plant metagenome]|uniref:KTSC domain-containing protein n=1 Tax=plant metagenome TaxID=1297885 RepID=A0A484P3Q2_9ZZZZ
MITPSIPLKPVQSSQIAAIGHDPATSRMAIRFADKAGKRGALYHYSGVSADVFAALAGAESVGSHFYRHIKPHADLYPYTRIDETTATQATAAGQA